MTELSDFHKKQAERLDRPRNSMLGEITDEHLLPPMDTPIHNAISSSKYGVREDGGWDHLRDYENDPLGPTDLDYTLEDLIITVNQLHDYDASFEAMSDSVLRVAGENLAGETYFFRGETIEDAREVEYVSLVEEIRFAVIEPDIKQEITQEVSVEAQSSQGLSF